MSTAPEVRETLRQVAETVDVPPIDEVAFGRKVRRARSGALGVRATAGAAAVALVAGAAFVGTTLVGTGPRGAAPAVGPPQGVLADERPPVYLSVGGRLAALDPLGEVHDLGVPVDWHPHGTRAELLADLGLTAQDVAREITGWATSGCIRSP